MIAAETACVKNTQKTETQIDIIDEMTERHAITLACLFLL